MVSESGGGRAGLVGGDGGVGRAEAAPSLLRFEYSDDPNRVVMTEGDFVVVHMKLLSRAWLEELWEKVQAHRSMFWEPSHAELENFVDILFTRGWLFFEVYKFGSLIGFFYFTNVDKLTDVQFHGIAFDRRLTDKAKVIQRIIGWLFENYHLQRIEALTAVPFRATVRFLERVGFVKEGIRRKAVIYRGQWKDQAVYSVTREEVCRF